MRASDYKRSKTRVDACLKRVGDSLIALEPLRIHIPERFAERDLAVIEDVSCVLGFLAIITEDNYYAASTVTGMFYTDPDRVGRCVVDDKGYIELSYDKGSRVISNTNIVMIDNMIHRVYTEMYGKGNIPWYYSYEDLPRMFYETGKYNGVKLGADLSILEYAAAQLCRDPDDPTKYYRQRPNAKAESVTNPPYFVGLRNVAFGATNLASKLPGSYFDDGMTSVLTRPSDRSERLETMLRQ